LRGFGEVTDVALSNSPIKFIDEVHAVEDSNDPTVSPYHFALNLPNQALIEIGKIVVAFAHIEEILADFIGRIVTVGGRRFEVGAIVTAELSFRQRVAMLSSLLHFALPVGHECLLDLDELRRILYSAEKQRNNVVHSVWGRPKDAEDSGPIVRMKRTAKERGGLRVQWVEMSVSELKAVTAVVGEAWEKLAIFEGYLSEQQSSQT